MKIAFIKVTIAIVMIALFLLVNMMDYHDKMAEEIHYAHMVCNGYWPDYADIRPDCETL